MLTNIKDVQDMGRNMVGMHHSRLRAGLEKEESAVKFRIV